MINLTNENFKELFPKIESAIKNASFISIDAEFTGIKENHVAELSLFDSMSERYIKLKDNIKPFIAVQVGITTFQYVRDENKYVATPFSCYLLPKPLAFEDRQFTWQSTALEFLAHHNFNFHKLFYESLSFLDEESEQKLRLSLSKWTDSSVIFDCFDDESRFTTAIEKVATWLGRADSEASIELTCPNKIVNLYLQRELRHMFSSIWTETRDASVVVIKVSADTRTALEETGNELLDNDIVDYYLGFTKVFKLLLKFKKPIIGHNTLLDLMFMYKQFYRPLPRKYSDFKAEIHRIFPVIYDTKYISYELKRILNTSMWKSNILSELYEFFIRGGGHEFCIGSPTIESVSGTTKDQEVYHDAGWDAYICGYCFMKCAYVLAVEKRKCPSSSVLMELTNTEILYGVRDYINCVNVIRGDLSHLKLDGDDPSSTRPPWLTIKTAKSEPIDIKKVTESLACFTPVAIRPQSRASVLVATANYRTANEILRHFQRNKNYKVVLYNPMRSSTLAQSLLWGGLVISGGLLTWFFRTAIIRPGN